MNQDFKELLAAFNAEKVKYLVIGGYAVIKFTEPRYTKDLDLWVSIKNDNPIQDYRALKQFGAPLTNLSPKDFSQNGIPLQRAQRVAEDNQYRSSSAYLCVLCGGLYPKSTAQLETL